MARVHDVREFHDALSERGTAIECAGPVRAPRGTALTVPGAVIPMERG